MTLRLSVWMRLIHPLFILTLLHSDGCQQLPKDLSTIVLETKPSVVQVLAYGEGDTLIETGTGFFITHDEIITNRHVIEFARTAKVKLVSGDEFVVSYVTGSSDMYDIIRLGVDVRGKDIQPLHLYGKMPTEGERVVVVGNPLGLTSTISDGIVSSIRSTNGVRTLIQISAPISPGSSGSPVLDMYGRVVGIATMQMKEGQNLNFALPVYLVDSLHAKLAMSLLDWQNDILRWKAKQLPKHRIQAARISEAVDWKAEPGSTKDSWHLTKLKESHYDRAGNLIHEIQFKPDGSIEKRIETVFDEVGRELVTRSFDSNGALYLLDTASYRGDYESETELWGEPTYQGRPNADNNPIRSGLELETRYLEKKGTEPDSEFMFIGRAVNPTRIWVTTHDRYRNVTEVTFAEGGAKPLVQRLFVYHYNDKGLKIQEIERQEWSATEFVRTFDNLERVVHMKEVHSGYPGNTYRYEEEYWYTYDKAGNQVEEIKCMVNPFGGYEKLVRTFDSFGNLETEDRYDSHTEGYEFRERRLVSYKLYQ